MKKIIIFALGLTLISCGGKKTVEAPAQAEPATTRMTTEGEVTGFIASNGAHVWRGVSYASDTSGENRWRAPRPAPVRSAPKEALEFGPVCPQIATAFTPIESFENGTLEGSEDCLAFDIYAPPNALGKNLPVMMWIHGGSNVSGASQLYVGDTLAVNENVIILSVQYRLGPLGWFSHEALRNSAQTLEDKAANFGLLDQIAALKWIRANIESFGGDPDNVTIFGESAGGHDVAALLASPLAKGLFQKAVLQSGSFESTSASDAEGTSGSLPNPSGDVAAKLGVENFHTATTQQVFDAFKLDGGGFMDLPRIIQDGVSLPNGPMKDAFKSTDTFNAVPIITGTNRDELKLFYLFNEDLVKKSFGFLYKARDQNLYDAASDYSGRNWRIGAVDQPAALMNSAGHDAVYAYRFDWDEGGKLLTMDLSKLLGAAHGVEIPFVFGRYKLLGSADKIMFKSNTQDSRNELSLAMGEYWASFARSGRPAAKQNPAWLPYSQGGAVMHLDSRNDGGIRMQTGGDSSAALLKDLGQDARLDNPERCRILAGLSQLSSAQIAAAKTSFNCEG